MRKDYCLFFFSLSSETTYCFISYEFATFKNDLISSFVNSLESAGVTKYIAIPRIGGKNNSPIKNDIVLSKRNEKPP